MPNGKCGDHPVTDILIHKRRTYSAEADSLIAEIVRLGGRNEFERSINPFAPPPLPELEKALREMHERILKEAKEEVGKSDPNGLKVDLAQWVA